MKFKVSNEPLSVFAYSSLTDIVMLLLVFFLLTSQFVIHTGVKVQLPGAKTFEQSSPTRLIVTLTSVGGVYLGNEEIGIEELAGRLESAKDDLTEDNLIIRADKTVAVDLVIQVIDAARGIGLDKFTIETEKVQL